VREKLLEEKIFSETDFIPAPIASEEEILLVHTRTYLDKLIQGRLSAQELHALELPYSQGLVTAARICVGGTILAARVALEQGAAVHLGGGFHHAFTDHGEGFCVLNDVACAARWCRQKQGVERILICDCDLHQGNGNAKIFKDCPGTFTFSIHQQNNYPAAKPPSDLDVGLDDGVGDQEYLNVLKNHLPRVVQDLRPQLIFYIAGADPYLSDQLGGLRISLEGLAKRDKLVLRLAKRVKASVVVVFGGGYAQDINDTATIHYNTVKLTREVFSENESG